MKRVVQLLSGFIVAILLLIFIAVPIMGEEKISALFGCDIRNISIESVHRAFEFSLVDRFPVILLVGLILICCFTLICVKAESFIYLIKSGCSFLKSYCVNTFHLIKQSDVKYFLLLSLGTTVYLAYCYPLTLDEPQTYFEFVKPPFWHALSFYPYPNNHVFSSLLINITNAIPGLDLLFKLRIPAIIISLLTWIFAYRFVKKYFTENLALFVVAIGTVVVTNIQHAYIARGYAFVMFFVVIGIYAAYNIIYQENRRRDWLIFAISSALGAWTMPSYLYPFLSISIFIFIYNYKAFKLQVLYSALVGLLVFVFYSPILVVTGLDSLTSNEFVATIDRLSVVKGLPGFMLGVVVHIFYMPYYVVIGLFLLVLLYTLIKKDRKTIVLWLVFGITPFVFLILHSVLPFFRTFFYYGFIFVFLIGVSISSLLEKIDRKILTFILLSIHILGVVFFFKISKNLMPEVFQSDDIVEEILEDRDSYYFHDRIPWMLKINLEFEAERKGYDIKIKAGQESDVEKLPVYDYYLIDKATNSSSENVLSKEMVGLFNRPILIYKNQK